MKKNLFDPSIFKGKGGEYTVELVTETPPITKAIINAVIRKGKAA